MPIPLYSLLKRKKKIALFFLILFLAEIFAPSVSYALTAGPTQPEFQAFTPVAATDMVDLFTGDFSYNIPLMDVDGYPINIAYHNVSNADQESSWVGLGWNLNLGEIDRSVRGLPDDFNGETINKYVHIKPEKDNRLDLGLKLEIFGLNTSKIMKLIKKIAGKDGKGGGKIGIYYGNNNYYGQYGGVSLGIDVGGAPGKSGLGVGLDMDFSSNNGADIGVSVKGSYATSCEKKNVYGMGLGMSAGFNTRNGIKDMKISGNVGRYNSNLDNIVQYRDKSIAGVYGFQRSSFPIELGVTIPIGLINYIPTLTNQSRSDAYSLGISVPGIKLPAGLYGTISGSFSHSVVNTDNYETRSAYGYLYLGNSNDDALLDYVRDNGGIFNKNIPNLPLSSLTYDLYNVNAQGTGGNIRPYRNDLGAVHDPQITEPTSGDNFGLAVEIGLGGVAEIGADLQYTNVKYAAGPIPDGQKHNFKNGNSLFTQPYLSDNQKYSGLVEPYYFKQQGEYNTNDEFSSAVGSSEVYKCDKGSNNISKKNNLKREPRANMTYFYNTSQAMTKDVAYIKKIENYTSTDGLAQGMHTSKDTLSKNANGRSPHLISEITQVSSKGERYVFGIPAMNNLSVDYTVGVDQIPYDHQTGLCLATGINSLIGGGRDEYKSYTPTPAYAHSYLLSAILSSDYIDVTGDGITPDDLGNFVKFNYSLKDSDYRWRMPYSNNRDSAFYDAGYNIDKGDNRATYSVGSKELWYAHSIETKNMVAEFYTSPKADGKGVTQDISLNYVTPFNSPKSSPGTTYKLDSLKLYNKNDRFQNGAAAIPIKTIYFEYEYELCKNTPNSNAVGQGKLTLKRIYTKFGNSEKSLLSPYQFQYSSFNPDYNVATKNKWGTYQSINPTTPNYLFPYVDQTYIKDSTDKFASAWQLTNIKLPTGGEIKVSYESDDYAYVQNKRATEMTKVLGMGSSSSFASSSSQLYTSKDNTNDFIFVKKRGSNYFDTDLMKVFLDNDKLIYFSYAVDLINKNYDDKDNYDQVKGFAEVEDVGTCPDNPDYLFIHIKKKELEKGKFKVNPITYAGINLARKDLSHFLYPGGDNPSAIEMFKGLWGSIKELINSLILINPVKSLVKHSKAKNFDPSRSFVRLTSPDLMKKGGGCRVRRIELNDNWDKLISGEPNSSYGNEYDYTTEDSTYKKISSGVASYEPQVGGDENPCKGIQNYKVQKGSNFPMNEPIHDMQFTPLGETFYPSPVVGYSKVTTRSIHASYAYSAQAYSVHEFYTAKDFPVLLKESKMEVNKNWRPWLIRNENSWYGIQAYSLILNDMHGKPKKLTNYAKRDPNATTKDVVSSIEYVYAKKSNGELDNTVKTLNYNTGTGQFEIKDMILGQEIDLTTDSRYSRQRSFTAGIELNVNWEVPYIFVPSGFPILRWDIKKFGSYVNTKVVQQYGMLKETIITTGKSVNRTRNEVFNPETGQAIVKSYNNEYGDREYETNYPATWAYKGMSAIYQNLFYNGKFDTIKVNTCKIGEVVLSGEQSKTLCAGDELLLNFSSLGTFKVWVGEISSKIIYGANQNGNGHETPITICYAKVYPRDPASSIWAANTNYLHVGFEVIRSGRKNQLESSIQQSVSMNSPINGTSINFTPSNLINLNTSTFDSKNVIKYYSDTCNANPFITGIFGNLRPSNSYVYYKNRDYTGHNRTEGRYNLSSGDNFWNPSSGQCNANLEPIGVNPNWKPAFNKIWYAPWGEEVQDINALGISSSAQFVYAKQLPTAVASNVQHNAFMYEGFEDYNVLNPLNTIYNNYINYNYSPFKEAPFASNQSVSLQAPYFTLLVGSGCSLNSSSSHTGKYSLNTPVSSSLVMTIPVLDSSVHYNKMFLKPSTKYIFSLWVKATSSNPIIQVNGITLNATTNEIDGWKKYEAFYTTSTSGSNITLTFPNSISIDDIRMFPSKSNMKSFVYNDLNNRLMASLDENNYATFYEYDAEGILLRTKKETEKGIVTLGENRSSNKKQ